MMSLNNKNRILTLIEKAELRPGLSFPKGFQFQVIQGVAYSNGFPIQNELQSVFLEWINNNPNLFSATTNY